MRLCAVCAMQGKACCFFRDILLSDGDVQRIAGHCGQQDFFELRLPSSPDYLCQDDDPNWNHYTLQTNGVRPALKHGNPGACFFLGEAGCGLPEQVRPLVCRLHPFEYNEQKLTGLSADCPTEQLPLGDSLLTNLVMNEEAGEEWRQQLYHELRDEFVRGHGSC